MGRQLNRLIVLSAIINNYHVNCLMIDIAKKAENDEKSEFVGNIPTISKLSRWGWQPSLHHSEIYLTFDRLWLCDHMSIWTNEHNSFQILTYHKIELQLVPLLCWFCDTSLWTSFVHCCIINYNYHNTPYHGQIGRDTTFQNILLKVNFLLVKLAHTLLLIFVVTEQWQIWA